MPEQVRDHRSRVKRNGTAGGHGEVDIWFYGRFQNGDVSLRGNRRLEPVNAGDIGERRCTMLSKRSVRWALVVGFLVAISGRTEARIGLVGMRIQLRGAMG